VVLYADQLFWHFNKDKTSADRNDYTLFSFTAVATGLGSALAELPVYAVGNASR